VNRLRRFFPGSAVSRWNSRFRPVAALALLFALAGCTETVPVTGRSQLALIPDSALNSMGAQEFRSFMSSHRVARNEEDAAMVRRVGRNIQRSVEDFLAKEGASDRVKGFVWEFELIESKEVNAFALPGGKVVVYTGLLPVTEDEDGLAVIIGHEVAHAVAGHGKERMSQSLLVSLGGAGLAVAMREKPSQTRNAFLAAYGAGTSVGVLLPFSRQQEKEADRLGLIFMALGGYDPRVGVDLWRRMSAKSKGAKMPEVLSTHPSDETRIRTMEECLPEAMQYRRKPGEPMPEVDRPLSDKEAKNLEKRHEKAVEDEEEAREKAEKEREKQEKARRKAEKKAREEAEKAAEREAKQREKADEERPPAEPTGRQIDL